METYEKDILKKEITDEVKESLTRSNGKLITRRILLALLIIALEALIWLLITTSAIQDESVGDGIFVCYIVLCMRVGQIGALSWFKSE